MTDNFVKALKKEATKWAKKLTQTAKSLAPKHIAPYITSSSDVQNGKAKILLNVKRVVREKYGTLDALAQEYGSGLHGKKKQKYPILPKNKKALVFAWDTDWPIRTKEGKAILTKVMHPGIKPYNNGKGYIRPAIQNWRKDVAKQSKPEFRKAIVSDIRSVMSGMKKRFG